MSAALIRTAEGWKHIVDVSESNYGLNRAETADQSLAVYPFQAEEIDEAREENVIRRELNLELAEPEHYHMVPESRIYTYKYSKEQLERFVIGLADKVGTEKRIIEYSDIASHGAKFYMTERDFEAELAGLPDWWAV